MPTACERPAARIWPSRLKPFRVLGRESDRAGQIVRNGRQLDIRVPSVQMRGPRHQWSIERLDQLDTGRKRLHHHAPTVFTVAQPANESGCLQPIDDRRHGASRQARVTCQLTGSGRAGEVEEIETLEVGGVDADELCYRVADEHRLGAHFSNRLVELLEQFGSSLRRPGHNILWIQASRLSRYLSTK